jgi:hypothetical protein
MRIVRLSGMTRKAWEKSKVFQLQLKGWGKCQVIGFPEIPLIVILREEGRTGFKMRTQKVALLSRRKSTSFPSTLMVIWGSWMVMTAWIKAGKGKLQDP